MASGALVYTGEPHMVVIQLPNGVAGRGAGAALGVIAVAVVALGTYLSHRVIEKSRAPVRDAIE